MEYKKSIVFDPNSWLVSQLEQRFRSINLSNGSSLWTMLVDYFQPENGECDYLFDQYEGNSLYPRFYYRRDTHTLFLEGFEWVSPEIKSVLTNDFLTSELATDNLKKAESQQSGNSGLNPKKRTFFQRLFGLNKQSKITLEEDAVQKKVCGHLDLVKHDAIVLPDAAVFDHNIALDRAAEILSKANGLTLSQAREALYKKSYRQLSSCTNFLSRLENEQIMKQETAGVNLDLSFLSDAGFFNLPETKEFRNELTNNFRIEWLLDTKEFNKNHVFRTNDHDLLDL